jgi:hypothetical protein
MDALAPEDGVIELTVTFAIAEAAARDGIRLPVGRRVRLTLITDDPPRRVLPFVGMTDSGRRDLGTRAKDITRIGMGRRSG